MQGTIAKKPYNPILGEIFRCYWDLPCSTRTPPNETATVNSNSLLSSGIFPRKKRYKAFGWSLCDHSWEYEAIIMLLVLQCFVLVLLQKLVDSGPVSFASYNSVTFIAEQVSHHPPSKSHWNLSIKGFWNKDTSFLIRTLHVVPRVLAQVPPPPPPPPSEVNTECFASWEPKYVM